MNFPAVAFNLDVMPPIVALEFEVIEKSDSFDITANLFDGECVRLGVTSDRVVHIVVEKSADYEDAEGVSSSPRREFLQRAVPLPLTVDEKNITASYIRGELKMCLPKRAEHILGKSSAQFTSALMKEMVASSR